MQLRLTSPAVAVDATRRVLLDVRAVSPVVYTLSVALAVVEVGRVPLTNDGNRVAIAVAAAVPLVLIHLWHLRYALRGERAPHSGPTLLIMAAINLGALITIGPAWSFMLAMLATSALVVLRPPWSLVAVAACVAGPSLALAVGPHDSEYYVTFWYLSYSVLFRSVVQFAIVWLASAATQLVSSRSALAADAVERERVAMREQLHDSLHTRLVALGEQAQATRTDAHESSRASTRVGVRDRLDAAITLADDALADLRRLVAAERAGQRHSAATLGLVRSARAGRSPVGRGLVTRQAWGKFVGVHLVTLTFLLLAATGTLLETHVRSLPFSLACWLVLVAAQVAASWLVARNRSLPHPLLWFCGVVVVVVVAMVPLDPGLESLCWLAGSMAIICLPGRWAIGGLAASVLGYIIFDTIAYTIPFPGATPYLCVWNFAFGIVLMLLIDAGLVASAQLVAVVAELDTARDALSERAAHEERRRISRDLHDVLGQSLTAASLKADLARRLLPRDFPAARREIDDLACVAASLVEDLDAVARDEREVAFHAETESAIDLLQTSGVAVSSDVRLNRIDQDASLLLGWVMREGTTNILRHAVPRVCSIRAEHVEDLLRLEIVNDGVVRHDGFDRRHDARGTGLQALSERVHRAGGRLESDVVGGDSFRLYVEVPP